MTSTKTKAWLARQRKDHHVRQAWRQGYRSRSTYKLIEIDRRDRLLSRGMKVVDLGAAPGGWSQYAVSRVGATGAVVAVDCLPMDGIHQVAVVQGDFTQADTRQRIMRHLGGAVDLVISDMAPNITGIREVDRARIEVLLDAAMDFARANLRPGGSILLKVFEGPNLAGFKTHFRKYFQDCRARKPAASRSGSREHYLLFRGLNITPNTDLSTPLKPPMGG